MLIEQLENASILESADDVNVLEAMSDEDTSQLMAVMLEDALSDDEMDEFLEEMDASDDVDYVEERTIVKLDKKAKNNRKYKLAILQTAKEKNDPNYKKLCTLWKMERYLVRLMEKKWGTKAKARARSATKKAASSSAEPMKKVAPKLTRSQRDTIAAKTIKKNTKLKNESNTVMRKLQAKIK